MVFNNIYPGFPWTQAFRFAAGVLGVGASVRADFKRHPAAATLLSVGPLAGITRAGDEVTITLTGAQTSLLEVAGNRVAFDFVRTPDEVVLGIRVTVPIVVSLADPV